MASDHSNNAGANCYKTFRYNQKYCCGPPPSFGRAFSLSQHDSSADSPINPALLPNISQVEMDIAIAKSATGHQPELLIVLLVSDLPDTVGNAAAEATRMNILQPTEQTNRPATDVVTDKGVPQSDIRVCH